jgi:mono/diheme cytochrome c family protein
MKARFLMMMLAACFVTGAVGCKSVPGRPTAQDVAARPEQVLDFPTLYKQNCAACHGVDGRQGAAISLANPVYLAIAGAENLQKVTASGVPGTLMPRFAKSAGGMLTDQQVSVLAQGMVSAWGQANALGGAKAPAYASSLTGDVSNGQKEFVAFCARCHGADGQGGTAGKMNVGSVVDPAYLALISDQGLRSILLAGKPEEGMPDWRGDMAGAGARPMTDQEVTDIVAWLGSQRVAAPGQPYARP